ncbi:MAG: BREX-1 system phosphatase PglZ type B [Bacillota bacterium]|jgi:hypothetical protein
MLDRTSTTTANTVLETVRQSLLRASRYDPGTLVEPAAVLWTDADGQWQPLVSQLRLLMPELLTLGDYNPEERTGPAIWLRCVIERILPEVVLPKEATPIIYMPNVSRQILRAGKECPDDLKPLVELQYRGIVWTQRNGRDWTIEAFLVSKQGLGLDVARDNHTRQAMRRSVSKLVVTPISRLRGKRLEAEDFDKLMVPDTQRDLLDWLSSPSESRKNWDNEKWTAFCFRCDAEYGFDPERDGELVAAQKLGLRETQVWQDLWRRFCESPGLYSSIPDILMRAKPAGFVFDKEPWPDENQVQEDLLRERLLGLETLSAADARETIEILEEQHGVRREWVWAQLGQSPLANALKHLVTLARTTVHSLGGDSPEAMADLYTNSGYLADNAVLRAISSVKSAEDARAVQTAVRSIYLSWLEDAAWHFQTLVRTYPLPNINGTDQDLILANPGECLVFADGLRFDIARRLVNRARETQLQADIDWRWAGLPTVTATAKPAVSPIARELKGVLTGEDFAPEVAETSDSLTIDRFRGLLDKAGYQVFNSPETGKTDESEARGWTEFGELDKLGHTLQCALAAHIDEQIELLLERVQDLLEAGWKRVRVVTDHGWLLVPGGFPVTKLPKYLTESRWPRCASIGLGTQVEVPTARWHWNPHHHFAFAPGICCFVRGHEYAHGGVSLQECVIPDLSFSLTGSVLANVKIRQIEWSGLRCRVTVDAGESEVTADLRTKPNDPGSSIAKPKIIDPKGSVALLVEDDLLEGTKVTLVLLDPLGRMIEMQATTVGGED